MVALTCVLIVTPMVSEVRNKAAVSYRIRRLQPATSAPPACRNRWPPGRGRRLNPQRLLRVNAKSGPDNGPGGKDPKVDWDNAWKSYRGDKKKGTKKNVLGFMDDYVSRSPPQPPKSRGGEMDPLRRTENSALDFWTNQNFTYAGIGVLVTLFVYMVIIIGPPPPR